MTRTARISFKILDLLIIFVLTFGSPMSALAYVWTDPTDYPPGSVVTIRGDNSDDNNDQNFIGGEHVIVNVTGPNGYSNSCEADADENGAWHCDITLWDNELAIGEYNFTAVGQTSGNQESGVFTDAASGNLDQCANADGPQGAASNCNPINWVNGNLGASKALYFEGDSIPYRLRMQDLTLSSHTVTIEWDTLKSGKHALDYITSFDRTVTTANPCAGVSGCSLGTFDTWPIPVDPNSVNQVAGDLKLFGGDITGVSAYSVSGGDAATRITITFTATVTNPVLAWGGHIATRADWGLGNSAVAIPGSPYHTRFIDLDGKGGNQDRSLSAEAVVFPGSITIVKDAVPDDAQDFGFTSTGGLGGFSLDDDADGTLSNTQFFPGIISFATYTFTEEPVSGWTLSFGNPLCTVTSANGGSQSGNTGTRTISINLQEGENVTCTFINTRQAATLTLIKTVINDNGGSADASDFQAYIDGNAVPWNSAQTVSPGSHVASESNLPGYTPSSWGGDCAADGSVSLAAGQNKTCTVTNDDQQAYITVTKVVNNTHGGTASPNDFGLTLEGSPVSSGVTVAVAPGTYTAAETQLPGYTFDGFSGDCDSNGDITVALGESKTCTLTNSDQAATITVIKVVNNDHGGTAAADDFDLTLEGNPVTSGVAVEVTPGTYTAGETQLPGYTFDGFSGDCDSNGDVTVALGESKICTLTNSDKQSYVIVEKVVINDNGGSADPDDFNLTLDGNATTSGTLIPVNPGTYTAGETQLSGYTFEGFSGDCDSNGDVTVALGETKTCTLTNNDQQAYITVVKLVDNNNGGSANPDDFNLTLEGNPVSSGVAVPVDPGTYTAGETLLPGYSFTGYSGACDSNGDVTVALGESKTCYLSNNDQQAYIIVEKVVINDNGGSADPDDFNLTLDGNATTSGALIPVDPGTYTAGETQLSGYTFEGFSGQCDGSGHVTVALGETKTCTLTNNDQQAYIAVVKVVNNTHGGSAQPNDFNLTLEGNAVSSGVAIPVDPGTYTAGETLLSGYTFDGFSGDCNSSGDTTVALGETKTCTLTNSDQQAYITVVKVVNNTHGGGAQSNDFHLTLEGNAVASGVAVPVNPGIYTAGETQLSGYTFDGFSGDCDSSGDTTVALGESKTCTLTNSDQQAYITVVKVVMNSHGGSAGPNDFNLTLEGSAVSSGVAVPVNPGTYTAGETLLPGYDFVSFTGNCDSNGDVTVALGQSKTCILTNKDKAPILHLRKIVINDNGGTKTEADFTLTANGTGTNDLSGTNPVDSGSGLQADTWALSETNVYGYSASAWSCVGGTQNGNNITLDIGHEATCTITNDDQPGTIVIIKNAKPAQGSFAFTTTTTDGNNPTLPAYANFTLTGSTVSNGNVNSQTLDAGTYTVKETTQLAWFLTGIGGSLDPTTPYNCVVTGSGGSTGTGDLNTQTATISLKNGDTVTCTFENTAQGATRTQGFWATHPQLAQIAWFGGSQFGHTFPGVAGTTGIGNTTICSKNIDNLGKLMGGFWSDVSKKTTNAKRNALDQARMQLLQQLLAAELNASAFGSVPAGGSGQFAVWEAALCGTNQTAIQNAMQGAASFNNSGDSATFTPGTSADSRYARTIANKVFWDSLP